MLAQFKSFFHSPGSLTSKNPSGRTTVIGESIRRVLEFSGHEVHGRVLRLAGGLNKLAEV